MNQGWDQLPFEDSSLSVDRSAIAAASNAVGLPFPPEYVEFLLVHNGGKIGHWPRYPIEGCKRDTHGMLKVLYHVGDPGRNDVVDKYEVFRERMPMGLLPIGSDPGGNQLCLICTGERVGQVVFWEMAFEANTDEGEEVGWDNVYRVADDLGNFFRCLNLEEN